MFKIPSFKYFTLPDYLQKYLEETVLSQKWVETKKQDIRSEAIWMNKDYIPNQDDLKFPTYDRDGQEFAYNPKEIQNFGKVIIDWLGINNYKFAVEMWEGSEDTGWHSDLNSNSDKYTVMLYYTPQNLEEIDGGLFQTLADTLIPKTGDVVLFEPKEDTIHQATKIKTSKKRYSIMIRVFK